MKQYLKEGTLTVRLSSKVQYIILVSLSGANGPIKEDLLKK